MNQGFNNKGGQLFVPPVTSGSGAPNSTPTVVGALYLRTDNDTLYQARGLTSSDWVQLTIT